MLNLITGVIFSNFIKVQKEQKKKFIPNTNMKINILNKIISISKPYNCYYPKNTRKILILQFLQS